MQTNWPDLLTSFLFVHEIGSRLLTHRKNRRPGLSCVLDVKIVIPNPHTHFDGTPRSLTTPDDTELELIFTKRSNSKREIWGFFLGFEIDLGILRVKEIVSGYGF